MSRRFSPGRAAAKPAQGTSPLSPNHRVLSIGSRKWQMKVSGGRSSKQDQLCAHNCLFPFFVPNHHPLVSDPRCSQQTLLSSCLYPLVPSWHGYPASRLQESMTVEGVDWSRAAWDKSQLWPYYATISDFLKLVVLQILFLWTGDTVVDKGQVYTRGESPTCAGNCFDHHFYHRSSQACSSRRGLPLSHERTFILRILPLRWISRCISFGGTGFLPVVAESARFL